MKKNNIEMAVGLFVIIGLLCLGYLSIKLGKLELIGNNYYKVYAVFDSVSGLKNGASVEIAGIEVGRVERVFLNEDKRAVVELKIENSISLQYDVVAVIRTKGIIGDKFIKILPGGDEEVLKEGDIILDTETPLELEEIIGQFIHGKV